MAPCRVTDMSGREVAVGAIELHGLRMRCNNGNVRASRAWVCEGMSRGPPGRGRATYGNGLPGASVRAVGMACYSCAIESGMARGWPMRMSSDGAIKKDSRSPCRHCARRPPANCSGGWLGVRASDLTADARGRATAMTCQYMAGRCATCPRTGEAPVPWAKKPLHFSCRLVDRKPVVRVGCFARGKVPPIRSSVAPLRKRRFRKSRQARPCRLHFDCPLIRAGWA